MKTTATLFIAFLSIVLFSCNNQKEKLSMDVTTAELKSPPQQNNKTNKEPQIPVGTAQQNNTDSTTLPTATKTIANPDWDKKIIKTATLKLEVKDFKNYNTDIHKTVKQYGGYIAQEEQNLSDEKSETVISIKVPVEQFENMMNQLPGGEIKIWEKKITTEDVTGQVVDTKSRLEAKKQMRLKYLEFLKQSKNMEEVLQVQNEVNGIQEEIESASGRVDYLSHQAAYSTINLTFFQPLPGYKPVDESPTFFTRISSAFQTGAKWIADLFVGLISIWPLLLIILGAYIGYKKIKSDKKNTIINTAN